jgi:RNA polymerase sigma-70 factor (ECF subfamily)
MLNIHRQGDEELIRGCIKKQAKAQSDLYESYSPIMYGVCLRYLKEPETAEEVMVTGFTKVFDKVGQFKFEGSFEGWVRRIMVNESLTFIRKNKYMYMEVDIETADREPDLNHLEDHLEAEDLMKIIQKLPVGYRTVFNMYAIEGYSHKEIAQQLGVSENTSKSQLSRARATLKQYLLDTENYLNENIQGS